MPPFHLKFNVYMGEWWHFYLDIASDLFSKNQLIYNDIFG